MGMEALFSKNPSLYNPQFTALQSDPRFGTINGYPVGSWFKDREACYKAKVHATPRGGIIGSPKLGAYSIVISNGYEDNEDYGRTLIYSGTGGKSDSTELVKDQTFANPPNAALQQSCLLGKPVRVIRGPNPNSKYAPNEGFRYDGLYKVIKAELAVGKSGYKICRFELTRLPGQEKVIVSNDVEII